MKKCNEECTLYDRHINEIEVESKNIYRVGALKEPNIKEEAKTFDIKQVNPKLRKKINKEIYKWYVFNGRFLLKLIFNHNKFR